MKRPVRITLNLLLPPMLAAGILVAVVSLESVSKCLSAGSNGSAGELLEDIAGATFMITFYAYVIAGIPSLLHATSMEFAYLKFSAERWPSVYISALSGSLSGLLIADFLTHGSGGAMAILIALGCAVGFTLGLLIKRLSRSKTASVAHAPNVCE